MEINILVAWAILIALTGAVLAAALKYGLGGALVKLAEVRADVADLDRAESGIDAMLTPAQLSHIRDLVFPFFALGLAITPQGDLREAISRTKELTDILTDSKPNTPPDTSAAGTVKDGAAG